MLLRGLFFLLAIAFTLARLDMKGCGISKNRRSRIIGGKPANAKSYPWMVFLEMYAGGVNLSYCGGSILNKYWIVTAAHCLSGFEAKHTVAYAGLLFKSKKDHKHVQKLKLSKIIIHPQYDQSAVDGNFHDIALLKTKDPINIKGSSGHVNGICLPASDSPYPTGNATITGWGLTGWNTLSGAALPTIKNCGMSNVTGDPMGDRIVGGREALRGEFPWQVSLRYNFLISSTHLCGATILNQRWIVTAAHCVYKWSKRNLCVAVGIHSQSDKFVTYSIDKLIMHEKYDPETFMNDIALLRTNKPLPMGGVVNGACLPQPNETATGSATASGWGTTSEDGFEYNPLRAVDLPIVNPVRCQTTFGGPDYYSTSAMLCAGYPQGGRDTCQGDSGGPLIQRRNGTAFLIGVVSSGVGCARPNFPGIYTKVSNYIGWIESNAN